MDKKLKFIIASCCQVDESKVDNNAKINHTPNWDSFNHLQIMMCVEKEFSVSLDTKSIASLTTYKDILDYLKSIKKKSGK